MRNGTYLQELPDSGHDSCLDFTAYNMECNCPFEYEYILSCARLMHVRNLRWNGSLREKEKGRRGEELAFVEGSSKRRRWRRRRQRASSYSEGRNKKEGAATLARSLANSLHLTPLPSPPPPSSHLATWTATQRCSRSGSGSSSSRIGAAGQWRGASLLSCAGARLCHRLGQELPRVKSAAWLSVALQRKVHQECEKAHPFPVVDVLSKQLQAKLCFN